MADMMDTLKGLLGDNAEDKLSGIMQILNSDSPQGSTATEQPTPIKTEPSDVPPSITPEMLMAAQSIIGRLSSSGDDNRTKLLMSLKPYMNNTRKETIDNAVKMLRLSEMSELFKGVI